MSSQMKFRPASAAISLRLVIALSLAGGCSPPGSGGGPVEDRSGERSQEQQPPIQYVFSPAANERALVLSLVRQAARQYGEFDTSAGGEVHKFEFPRGPSQYLLVAPGRRDESDGLTVLMFLLTPQEEGAEVSIPLVVQSSDPDPDFFAVLAFDDLSGDGRPEVAYCVWIGSGGEPGELLIKRYMGGSWRTVEGLRSTQLSC